jgi:hypothetical protein
MIATAITIAVATIAVVTIAVTIVLSSSFYFVRVLFPVDI